MTTVIDGITDYIVAQLIAIDQITNPAAVELEPADDATIFPSLGVIITGARPLERETGLIRWEMNLTIDGFVEFGDGTEGSAARSALHAACIAALMGDDRFGGLIEQIDPEDFRFTTATLSSVRRLSFAQDFAIQFTTLRTNPALPG